MPAIMWATIEKVMATCEDAVDCGGGQHGVQDRYHDEGEWEGHGGEHQRLPGGFEAVLAASEDGGDGSEEPRTPGRGRSRR